LWGARAAASTDDDYPEFWEEAEPPKEGIPGVRALTDWPLWQNQNPRPAARWAGTPEDSVDTRHLLIRPAPQPVEVTDAGLRKALGWAGVNVANLGERVLFGLRAAQLLDAAAFASGPTFRQSFAIAPHAPDHFRPGCVLGVWDTSTRSVWACPGSTVPNVAYLFGQAEAGARDVLCNMLPAGIYNYVVGTHRRRLPGAFRFDSAAAVVRRYRHPLVFTSEDVWDFRGPEVADNIHCAYQFRSGMPEFSSAGCQTMPGHTDGFRPVGAWRHFRMAAGLAPDPDVSPNPNRPGAVISSEDGRRYRYVLLPAQELGLAAQYPNRADQDPAFRKLRRGSSGDAVRALQSRLGGGLAVTGMFDAPTQRLLIQRQRIRQGWADGVVTRASLASLDLGDVM
jgi:hypothetical protein